MLTLRQAAALLAGADSADSLLTLASALGFDPVALPLDASARASLGLPPQVDQARVAHGAGSLRALLVVATGTQPLRTLLARIATALSARTGSVLWLVAGVSQNGEVGIACWPPDRRPPRLFALLAQRERIVASDADTVRAMAAVSGDDDLLVHTRWCELLGRDALSRRFYRTLEKRVGGLGDSLTNVPADDRGELGLLAASRLLFLAFLEAKGWLNGDHAFLARLFDDCMARGGALHQQALLPLWFGTLNTPIRKRAAAARRFGAIPFLNGGLFGKTALERRHPRARITDDSLGLFFSDVLGAYRFTAREEHDGWSEAAIDPEMLGRAFESLMAARERRVSGAFYTPQALVTHVADAAVAQWLRGAGLSDPSVSNILSGVLPAGADGAALRASLSELTVLDPACGSGAFLVHMLERITALRRLCGDPRPVAEIRRDVLARSIHGVDVNPTAVWLCELRLWLSVVIESEETRMGAVPPLPNLDCNIRIGDALAGDAFGSPPPLMGPPAALARLRERFTRASGARKAPLRRALEREERRRAIAAVDRSVESLRAERRERVLAARSRDLFGERQRPGPDSVRDARAIRRQIDALRKERRRIADGGALPFAFPSHFGHVHVRGGFGIVVGNPPWVRLHNIPAAARAGLRARFRVFRDSAWSAGARSGGAGAGFGAQVDLAALFVERSLGLVAPCGGVGLLLPAKLWRSLAGGGVRALASTAAHVSRIEDWSEAPCVFDAAVYPSVLLLAPRTESHVGTRVAVHQRSGALGWSCRPADLRFDASDPASPWLLLPPAVRAAFDRLCTHGIALGESSLGRPTLGVKCGCNDAFTVELVSHDSGHTAVTHRGRHGLIENGLLRPLLRGDAVAAWRVRPTASAILWTHAPEGQPLATLPGQAARWLGPWRSRLAARTDLRGSRAWWSLFRTEGAHVGSTRVVWNDFGRMPRAAVLAAGDPTVPLNSCYVLPCADPLDALAFAALLNSPLAAAWLNAIAEPARGGWHRYLAWTVSLLPLPRDWSRVRSILAPLAEQALLGDAPSERELLLESCRAYELDDAEVAPLVEWSARS